MKTADFDFELPKNLIAQKPIKPRENCRLMILNRQTGKISEDYFYNLPLFLKKGDVLVFNDSKVIPARLIGKRVQTGGKIEILLLRDCGKAGWEALISGHRRRVGQKIEFSKGLVGEIVKPEKEGKWQILFNLGGKKFQEILFKIGKTPTPPYIKKMTPLPDYQTVYAKNLGSVAAPTAGFHFSKKLINKLKKQKIDFEFVTLHIGLGTFAPIRKKNIKNHYLHSEWANLSKEVARRLNKAKKNGQRIIVVGTTTARVLETAANQKNQLLPYSGQTQLFIFPCYKFKFIDSLITNFHLPKSSLLLLVSAFAGQELIKKTYQLAIKKKYRFYSFGDAMFIK